ncbi:Mediator complex, subunit Med17 [Ceraceosorus bombacis]|uniref:Mediator of RNA polymerase II transcription subunit 17 n=1 Tax=Ceraceosorus bombacis TaxID=401625 RepID=A0A0N7LAX3_9BASI|nr:Mediator complex, subunit Med17 [Ceraceosorus bombacis]
MSFEGAPPAPAHAHATSSNWASTHISLEPIPWGPLSRDRSSILRDAPRLRDVASAAQETDELLRGGQDEEEEEGAGEDGALLRDTSAAQAAVQRDGLIWDFSSHQAPLSDRVAQLWAARGAFDKLDVGELRKKVHKQDKRKRRRLLRAAQKAGNTVVDEDDDGDEDDEKSKQEKDWGIPPEQEDEKEGDGLLHSRTDEDQKDHAAGTAQSKERQQKTLDPQQVQNLKGPMLAELNYAQESIYSAHCAVSLILLSRPTQISSGSSSTGLGRQGSERGTPLPREREGTATSTRAGAGAGAAAAAAAAGWAGRGVSAAQPGTAMALFEETGLEAEHVSVELLGSFQPDASAQAEDASEGSVYSSSDEGAERSGQNKDRKGVLGKKKERGAEEQEGEEADSLYSAKRNARYLRENDDKLSKEQMEDRTKSLVISAQAARDGILGAIGVLRRGARELDQVCAQKASPTSGSTLTKGLGEGSNVREEGSGATYADRRGTLSAAEREANRWECLARVKSCDWTLSGVANADLDVVLQDEEEAPEREGRAALTTLIEADRNKGARDAWIGWAITEAHADYKQRSLARVHSAEVWSPSAEAAASDAQRKEEMSEKLEQKEESEGRVPAPVSFVYRPNKRLQVSFELSCTGGSLPEQLEARRRDADGQEKVRNMHVDGHGKRRTLFVSSDANVPARWQRSKAGDEASMTRRELNEAQLELADEELFGNLVSEARALSNRGEAHVKITTSSLTIFVSNQVSMLIELIPTRSPQSFDKPTSPTMKDDAAPKGDEVQNIERVASAMPDAILGFLRLGLVGRYKDRACGSSAFGSRRASQGKIEMLHPLLSVLRLLKLRSGVFERVQTLMESFESRTAKSGRVRLEQSAVTFKSFGKKTSKLARAERAEGSEEGGWVSRVFGGRALGAFTSLQSHLALHVDDEMVAVVSTSFPSNITLHLQFPPAPTHLQAAAASNKSAHDPKDDERPESAAQRLDKACDQAGTCIDALGLDTALELLEHEVSRRLRIRD